MQVLSINYILQIDWLYAYLNIYFQAAQRYLDASLGYKLYLTLVDMLILEDDQVNPFSLKLK